MNDINNNLLWLLVGMFVALCIGTVVRMGALRRAESELVRQRMGSLKVWWILAALVSLAVVCGQPGVSVLLAVASAMGLREYLKLIGVRTYRGAVTGVAMASVVVQYALIAANASFAAQWVLPVAGLLVFSTVRLWQGRAKDFICSTAGVYWGVMLLVYCLSHAALLFTLPIPTQPFVGMAGWFLFVVIVTEMDDIAQALVGRAIGRHQMTPHISPQKTWEGFAGGAVTSVTLSVLLSPWLTTISAGGTSRGLMLSVMIGLLLVTAAFLGDINMSAVKRDAGVKDGSAIFPGMGGIIDRVDSLTFTAPVFYYFVRYVL